MNTDDINRIFEILAKNNPDPRTELQYKNPFTLLIAVMLSAQSTDIIVNKATKELFKNFDSPAKFLSLGEEGLKNYIKIIGLYNTKAKNILATCNILVNKFNNQIPNQYEALISLPGVGRKTANVVLNCLFNQETIAVDTHVFRVAKRLGLSSSNSLLEVENDLLTKIPKKWLHFAHHWLILHGRYICKARKPACDQCPLQNYCYYYKESQTHDKSSN